MRSPDVERPNAARRALLNLAFTGYAFGVVASVFSYIALSGISLIVMQYDKVILAITVLVGILGLLRGRRQGELDGFGLLMLFMVAWATGLGLLIFFFEDRSRSFRYFLPQFAGGLMMLVNYLYFSKALGDWQGWLTKFMERVAPIFFAVNVFSFLVYVVFIPELNIAFSASAILVPFAWYMVKRNPIMAISCLALIFISGKRGTMLAALLAVVVLLCLWSVCQSGKLRGYGFIGLISLGSLVAVIVPVALTVDIQTLPGPIRGSLGRIQLALRESEGGDLRVATAGRSGEVEDSWKTYSQIPRNYAMGTGYGWWFWNYGLISIRGYTEAQPAHYIHASPLNYVYLYGIPMASLFLLTLAGKLFAVFRYLARQPVMPAGLTALFIFIVARLSEGATGASWYTDPLIWMAMGLVVGMTKSPARAPVATQSEPATT